MAPAVRTQHQEGCPQVCPQSPPTPSIPHTDLVLADGPLLEQWSWEAQGSQAQEGFHPVSGGKRTVLSLGALLRERAQPWGAPVLGTPSSPLSQGFGAELCHAAHHFGVEPDSSSLSESNKMTMSQKPHSVTRGKELQF